MVFVAVGPGEADFFEYFDDEGLAHESGIDRHAEQLIDFLEQRMGVLHQRHWIDRHGTAAAHFLHQRHRPLRVVVGLEVNDEGIGAGLDEGPRVTVGLLDHQMHLDGQPGQLAHRLHHVGAKGKVGNEVAVHHVDVDDIDLRRLQSLHFLLEIAEVGGEQAGGEADGSHLGRIY